MTGRTRIAAVGTGALLSLGILSAAPAGASGGVQTTGPSFDGTVQARTADIVSQTLDLVNKACIDAARVTDGAADATVASGQGISVSSGQAGNGLSLAVSLPALTDSLPVLGSLPLLGSATGQVDADPLQINCATATDGTGLGVSAAGVDAMVSAIAPGIDLSGLDLSALDLSALDLSALDLSALLPAADVAASAGTTAAAPATSVSAAAAPAGSATATTRSAQSPAVRGSAAAQSAPTATLTPASSSDGILGQTVGTPGALARTGAGLGVLGLLGTALVGSGRLAAWSRRFVR